MRRFIETNILPIGILAGSVIGAGIFSLPYVFSQVGVLNGLIYLAIATTAVAVSHHFYAEVVMKSGVNHNFVNYSRYYLGEIGYWLAILMSIAQMLLVLVVYLILSQSFFQLVIAHSSFTTLIVFWLIGSTAVFFSLKRLAGIESAIVASIVAITLVIFFRSLPELPALEWNKTPLSVNGFLTAIGPLFFALGGRTAIVEMVRFTKKPRLIRKTAILGTMLPAMAYALFAIAVVALSPVVSEDAVSGIVLNQWLLMGVGILGLLSILSSYMVIGFDVNDILDVDLKWKKIARMALVVSAPIILYLVGFQNFLWLVSFTGGVFGVLTFIFIILMWMKATGRFSLKSDRRSPLAIILLILLSLLLIDQLIRFAM